MRRTILRTCLILVLATCTLALVSAPPLLANPVQTEYVRAELGSMVATIQPGTPFWVMLHLRMQEGWHTYWQNPGDSGLATTIRWVLPAGFAAGDIVWPYPQRLPVGPLMNYGYEGEVVLLTQISAPAHLPPDQSVTLQAETTWVVCAEICVPESARLAIQLPVRLEPPQTAARWQAMFTGVQAALPKPAPWPVAFVVAQDTITLVVETPEFASAHLTAVTFFPLTYGMIDHAAPQQMRLTPQGLRLTVPRGTLDMASLPHLDGVLVVQEKRHTTSQVQAFAIRAVSAKAL